MARRSESYNEFVADQMKDPEYAKLTILTSIEEFGENIDEALRYAIKKMGIKEFSELSGYSITYISDITRGRKQLKAETLNKLLSFFGLRLKTTVVELEEVA
jgi:repressor of nif and glnA expression